MTVNLRFAREEIMDKKKKKQKRKSIPEAQYDKNEEWVKTHIKQFGEEPSFF